MACVLTTGAGSPLEIVVNFTSERGTFIPPEQTSPLRLKVRALCSYACTYASSLYVYAYLCCTCASACAC